LHEHRDDHGLMNITGTILADHLSSS
jgi:hypothetical protein